MANYMVMFLHHSAAQSHIKWLINHRQSQWQRGLRRWSTVARLLGLQVLIPRMALSLASVVCCQVEVSASGSSLVLRSATECGVSECDLETSQRRPGPTRGVEQ